MNTFVVRDILDKSISGDKIFGGEIDWVDGLYTDHFAVPHDAGAGGTGSIDGSAFTIGITDRIALVDSSVVLGGSIGVWASDFSGYAAQLIPTATQYGTLYLNDTTGPIVQLTANQSNYSYHLPKLIIGATTPKQSWYKFEVHGSSYLNILDSIMANFTNAYADNFYFLDHLASWAPITYYTQLIDYLATNTLAGGIGPLLVDSLQEAADNITGWQMSQIANINDLITTSDWYHLSEMDQLVSIGSSVVFGTIDGSDITATGDIDGGTVTGDKVIEDGTGLILVSTMHGDIHGLHLDWLYPPQTATATRIVVEEGTCLNSSKADRITLASNMTKRIDLAWAAGTDNGGMPSPLTVQPSTDYWVFVIWNGSSADVGFDTSASAANLLSDSGYTQYRTLGRVHTDTTSKIDLFEDITMYCSAYRSVRSGFKLNVSNSYVSVPFDVYGGAERLGRTIQCWISDGTGNSNSTDLEYAFYPNARPTSLNTDSPTVAACNFLNGAASPLLLPGEIRLMALSDVFECLVFDGSRIHDDGFVNGASLKGIQQPIAFTFNIFKAT